MFGNPDVMAISGPPPQSILDKRPYWFLFIGLLCITMILRVVSLDMVGGLLCALMICWCLVILRDGMRQLGQFSLMVGLFCGVNFVCHAMPLVGAIIRQFQLHQLGYRVAVKESSFFDLSRGWIYNAHNAGELMMLIAMLFGTYLGLSSHYEFQSHMEELFISIGEDEEFGGVRSDLFGVVGDATASLASSGFAAGARAGTYGAIFGAAAGGVAPRPAPPKPEYRAFQGASHKLAP